MSSWPSATGRSSSRNSRTGRCSGPVCGSETKPSPAARARSTQPDDRRGRVRREGPRVAGHSSSLQAVLDHRLGQHRGRAQRRVARVVDQHRHPRARRGGEPAGPLHVLRGVAVGELDPGDPADHVGAQPHGLLAQLRRPGVPEQPVLREGDDLEVDQVAVLLPDLQHGRHALQPGGGVDVDERLHVEHAVEDREVERAAYVRRDPGPVVVLLDRRRVAHDRAHRLAHLAGRVRRQRAVARHRERVDLVEVQVPVHEGRRHQPALGVDHLQAHRGRPRSPRRTARQRSRDSRPDRPASARS